MRRILPVVTAAVLVVGGTSAVAAVHPHAATPWSGLRAGVGVADATWHVGAGAGQYASPEYPDPTDPKAAAAWRPDLRGEWDPNVQHVAQKSSYGVASRLSIRAIVLKGPKQPPVALVKVDNYLAQDMLTRRVGQLLAAAHSNVTYDHILMSATHDHNSPYYSSPAAGVWLFQDVMDLRMFEYQARAMAHAIEIAEAHLRPARVGATTVQFPDFQGNIAGADVNEDGSPTGYPLQDNDHGVVVMRFDDMTDPATPKPLATWVNYAEHGESLDGYDLISADWVAPFQRYVDRATGVPVVITQGSVGSAEGPYEHSYPHGQAPTTTDGGDTVAKIWGHMGYAQAERGAHLLAEQVIGAWQAIGGAHNGITVQAPYQTNPVVTMLTHWVTGPLSHPYPSVGNCRMGPTESGDPGVPAAGLPDCERMSDQFPMTLPLSPSLFESLKAHGAPIPDNYDVPSFGTVEENMRIKLQAVRIGDILLASCSCEAQSDLIKAIETRTDKTQGDRWNGFDYANQADVDEGWPGKNVQACHLVGANYDCPDPRDQSGVRRLTVSPAAFAHMEAEINNPSDGWDAPSYVTQANTEPKLLSAIKGNYTGHELSAKCGYDVSVGLGHTGDYDGYTVSYREYMARDAYRKALTSYGAHTGDYMLQHLMEMASNLSCGTPIPTDPTAGIATADELRQAAEARVLGAISSTYYKGWTKQIPDSAGPAQPLRQPNNIERFDAATFRWVGGDNWTDNPAVTVQRLVDGQWQAYADESGEIPVVLDEPPAAYSDLLKNREGKQRWTWTASFEAYDSYPRADIAGGQVPDGTYRFVVRGRIHRHGAAQPYGLHSNPFTVSPWTGLTGSDLRVSATGSVSFVTAPVVYPRTYSSPIRFVHDDGGGLPNADSVICKTCSFRPWATTGTVVSALVSVLDAQGHVVRTVPATYDGSRWHAAAHLTSGETAAVLPGGLRDSYGETNGAAIH
jgi:hypothetical protein